MPKDGPADDIARPATNEDGEDNDNAVTDALNKIRDEAQKVQTFGVRNITDVTASFTNFSKRLLPGQLVKDEYFTLFESVGALEIMDPKMDSGYVAPDDTFEPEFDLSQPLEANEVLWIMDQLLCLESTWLEGYPLSQTIFTSLHIDSLLHPSGPGTWTSDRQSLLNTILRPYCEGVIKCCHYVLRRVQSQTFYDEEDFVTHLFGRDLLPGLDAGTVDDSLKEGIQNLSTAILAADMQQALTARLRFRRCLLETLLDDGEPCWHLLQDEMERVKDTLRLSKPVPEAFSEKVQRQLATSTPPRPMLQVSFDTACKRWAQLGEDVLAAHDLTLGNIMDTPHCLQRATWAFAYREEPSALARAEFQSLIFGETPNRGDYDLLLTDLRELVLAGDVLAERQTFEIEVTTDPRHKCAKLIQGFMDKVLDEYLNIYRMVCQNRCRIRRLFTQAIGIWEGIETEGWSVDQEIKKIMPPSKIRDKTSGHILEFDPLASWAKFYKLRIMAWTIQLGFDTSIYMPDETSSMYWYLSILFDQQSTLLSNIGRFTQYRAKRLKDPDKIQECTASYEWLTSMQRLAEVHQSMATLLWSFFNLLESTGIIVPPNRDFADPHLFYEARMKPFLAVSNDPIPTAEHFAMAKQASNRSLETTCKEIETGMKEIKVKLGEVKKYTPEQAKYVGTENQWKKETKQLETTCVAVAVGASQLLRIHQKARMDELERAVECRLERKYHPWWVIPQLKERVQQSETSRVLS